MSLQANTRMKTAQEGRAPVRKGHTLLPTQQELLPALSRNLAIQRLSIRERHEGFLARLSRSGMRDGNEEVGGVDVANESEGRVGGRAGRV